MKNKITLASGVEITVNTYKMYAKIDYHCTSWHMDQSWPASMTPTTRHNANTRKMLMVEAIATGSKSYKKAPGTEPIGFVVEVVLADNTACVYGASIKSHLDKWDRIKGLKVAYAGLMSNSTFSNLSKEDRRKIATIIGLQNAN